MVKVKRKSSIMMSACLVLTLLLSACANNANEGNGGNNSAAVENTTGENASAEAKEPLGKYDPPIDISVARWVDAVYKYAEGEDISNNLWIRTYQDELGINIKYDWTVPGPQYEEKMNVSIASGELPNLYAVSKPQLKRLVESGLLADLTNVYEDYASPDVKELFSTDGGRALKSATFDGKLYGVPVMGGDIDTAPVLFIRTDWLKALNLEEPNSMQDVLAIAEAFATQDPDKNGKKDTLGLALDKNIWSAGWIALEGFFNGYNAYPQVWVNDDSGKLAFGSVQPEVKTALGALRELYQKGAIDPEFGVKDGAKVAESAGKLGMYFGAQWSPLYPLQAAKEQDPGMEWKAFPIPGQEGKPAKAQTIFPVNHYTVVLKDFEHPEAAVKLTNMFIEKMFSERGDYGTYGTNEAGIEVFQYAVAQAWPATKNIVSHQMVSAALESKDTSSLNAEQLGYYNNIVKFREGDIKNWGWDMVFGPASSQLVLAHYQSENLLQREEFYGAPTETMSSKKTSLDKMTLEVFTKIIMGESLDEFDKYVDNWKKLGGSDITSEVNEWKASQ